MLIWSRAVLTCVYVAQILIFVILGVLFVDLHILALATIKGTLVGFIVAWLLMTYPP